MSWLKTIKDIRKVKLRVRNMQDAKRQKYLAIFRMAYFFSASSLVMGYYYAKNKYEEELEQKLTQSKLEAGQPVVRDEDERYATMRKKGVEAGLMYEYSLDKGWHMKEYHRGEYLSELQKKALEDAKEAQRRALAEGRNLPPDAILLIDEAGSS